MGPGDLPASTRAILATFDSKPGEPRTSGEVADVLGVARTTASKKLQQLVEADLLQTKKVGSQGRVWWRPPEKPAQLPEPGRAESETERDYQALLASEQMYQAVFEKAFDAILIADDEGRYVEANPAACNLYGLPREELLGRTVTEFTTEGYDVEQAWDDFLEKDLDRGLFPLQTADGEQILVEFSATPDILPGRHLSVLRDVTERQQTKAALKREHERARRYQKSLFADTAIEVEIELGQEDVFANISADLDCSFVYEGSAKTASDRVLHYITITGASKDDALERATESAHVADYRVVFSGDESTFVEFEMVQSPLDVLLEAGATCRSMQSEQGVTTVVTEIGSDASAQELLDKMTETYPRARVVTKRTLERPIVTTRQYRNQVRERLTDRQTETLRGAYHAGYFEWPRASHAEEIAESMEIATSTWLRHLRLAESTLLEWVFEELEV